MGLTNQEAIGELKLQISTLESMMAYNMDFEPESDNTRLKKRIKTAELAVAALEKQIPKKVIDMKMFPGNCGEIHVPNFSGKCPSCGHAIIRGVASGNGCQYCLQALDWSE